jgi:hypothetical protein
VPTPPYADGEELYAGLIYRRYPGRPNYVNPASGGPTFYAFRPREKDRGALSAYLKDYVTEGEARTNPHDPTDRSFGLCVLDIAKIREATSGVAGVRYKRTGGSIGHAHVQIYGCQDVDVQQQLAVLAVVVQAPAG